MSRTAGTILPTDCLQKRPKYKTNFRAACERAGAYETAVFCLQGGWRRLASTKKPGGATTLRWCSRFAFDCEQERIENSSVVKAQGVSAEYLQTVKPTTALYVRIRVQVDPDLSRDLATAPCNRPADCFLSLPSAPYPPVAVDFSSVLDRKRTGRTPKTLHCETNKPTQWPSLGSRGHFSFWPHGSRAGLGQRQARCSLLRMKPCLA